jgi:hypothetical protein
LTNNSKFIGVEDYKLLNRDQWWALGNTLMNLRVPLKMGNLLAR